jgi:hypothetical protein
MAMQQSKIILLLVAIAASFAGCVNTDHVASARPPDHAEIAKSLNCTSEQVALCVETNCEPEEFQCADRGDVRDMFKAGEFRH